MNPLSILLLGIAALGFSCADSPRIAPIAGKPVCCATNSEPATAFTDKSLYQVDSLWTNDGAQPWKLSALRGRVQVMAMFFANCTYACPLIVNDMRRIEAALPEAMRARVGFTLITIDTERDMPDALRAYRSANKLPLSRWTLLHGTPDDTLELAALLGVKFKRDASGQFAHSNLITVLNREGEIIHQLAGLNQNLQETIERVSSAAQDPAKRSSPSGLQ